MANRLGSGDAGARLHWFGSAYWRNSVLWKNAGVSIVTAVADQRPSESPSTRVFAAALGSASDLDIEHFRNDEPVQISRHRRMIELRVDEARKIAALGREVAGAIATAGKLAFADPDPSVAPADFVRRDCLLAKACHDGGASP